MIRQRFSAVEKSSGGRSVQRAEHLQQGRFAASARARNGNELALVDGKIDSAQRLDLSFVELAGESFCLEQRALAVGESAACADNLPDLEANELRSIVSSSSSSLSLASSKAFFLASRSLLSVAPYVASRCSFSASFSSCVRGRVVVVVVCVRSLGVVVTER